MEQRFEKIVFNLLPKGVRYDRIGNKEYKVVPTVMLTEGVHCGSCGPLFYPSEELSKVPQAWNHKPVLVYHPDESITACTPEILSKQSIGIIMNTRFEKGKLKAEAWLDEERISEVDNRIEEAIRLGKTLELSTGLYTDLEPKEGEWNGEHYVAITRNYRPDHLAVLPDEKGACSIEDGAGFLRLNQQGEIQNVIGGVDITENYIRLRQREPEEFNRDTFVIVWLSESKGIKAVMGKLKGKESGPLVIQSYLFVKEKWTVEEAKKWVEEHKKSVKNSDMSYSQIWEEINNIISKKKNLQEFVVDIFEEYFIFSKDGEYYKQLYNVKDGKVEIKGSPIPVKRVLEYREEVNNMRKEQKMDKSKIVDELISNELTKWKEEDRDLLMNLEESVLEKMTPIVSETKNEEGENTTNEKKKETETKMNEKVVNEKEKKSMTAEEFIAQAPPEIQEILNEGRMAAQAERNRLIKTIISNKRNPFKQEELQKKSLYELRCLASLASEPEKSREFYVGESPTENVQEEGLIPVVINFEKKS